MLGIPQLTVYVVKLVSDVLDVRFADIEIVPEMLLDKEPLPVGPTVEEELPLYDTGPEIVLDTEPVPVGPTDGEVTVLL